MFLPSLSTLRFCAFFSSGQSLCSFGFNILEMTSVVPWAWSHHFFILIQRHIPFFCVGVTCLSYKIRFSAKIYFEGWFQIEFLFSVLVQRRGGSPFTQLTPTFYIARKSNLSLFLECPVSSLYFPLWLRMVMVTRDNFYFERFTKTRHCTIEFCTLLV